MRKRISQYTNFSVAMSSLKEFASARKKEPCPANTSPCSVSQLSRSSVETPVKEQSVHTNIKPSVDNQGNQTGGVKLEQSVHADLKPYVEISSLPDTRGNQTGGVALEHSGNCATPLKRTDIKPSVEPKYLGNVQGKPGDGFTLEHSLHSTLIPFKYIKPSAKQCSLGNMQGSQTSGFAPSSNLIQSPVSAVNSKGQFFDAERVASKLDKFKRQNGDVDGSERKVFNGLTLGLDFKPVNGENLVTAKSNELRVDGMKIQESDCVLKKKPESEPLTREQMSSPVLFATPQSSPSLSPVKQELKSPLEGKERIILNSSNLNLWAEEPTAIQKVENVEGNLGNNSITLSKKGGDFGKSPLEEDRGVVAVKRLFKSKEAVANALGHGGHGDELDSEKKPRDILDDVKENLSREKAGLENCLQTTVLSVVRNAESKENAMEGVLSLSSSLNRSERSCHSVSEMPSNVRLGRRRSTRLRRFSNSSRNTKEEDKEVFEVRVNLFYPAVLPSSG